MKPLVALSCIAFIVLSFGYIATSEIFGKPFERVPDYDVVAKTGIVTAKISRPAYKYEENETYSCKCHQEWHYAPPGSRLGHVVMPGTKENTISEF